MIHFGRNDQLVGSMTQHGQVAWEFGALVIAL